MRFFIKTPLCVIIFATNNHKYGVILEKNFICEKGVEI